MPSPMLDAAPPLPDSVRSQMGAPDQGPGGMAGAGEMLKKTTAFGGAPNAQGALRAQADAVKAVVQKMADAASAGKTFFSRAIQLLEQGMAAEAQGGPGTPVNAKPQVEGGSEATSGNKPPGSFPG
jgi:hypothetical protein